MILALLLLCASTPVVCGGSGIIPIVQNKGNTRLILF